MSDGIDLGEVEETEVIVDVEENADVVEVLDIENNIEFVEEIPEIDDSADVDIDVDAGAEADNIIEVADFAEVVDVADITAVPDVVETVNVDVVEAANDETETETEIEMEPELAPEKVNRILQALLLAAGEPLTIKRLLKCFKQPKPDPELMKSLLKDLQEEYEDHDVLRLIQTANGYQFQLANELSPWLMGLWEHKPPRYSRALLETLSLIAYKQPITRGDIEQVRGVAVSNHIIKTLLDREWVSVIGQREVPGRPCLYGTTKNFLDYFNLKKLSDLPDLPALQGLLDEKHGVAEDDEPIQAVLPLDTDDDAEEAGVENVDDDNTADADEAVDADNIVNTDEIAEAAKDIETDIEGSIIASHEVDEDVDYSTDIAETVAAIDRAEDANDVDVAEIADGVEAIASREDAAENPDVVESLDEMELEYTTNTQEQDA